MWGEGQRRGWLFRMPSMFAKQTWNASEPILWGFELVNGCQLVVYWIQEKNMSLHALDRMAEIRVAIMKMHKLKVQIAELEGQHKELQAEVVSTLGLKGVLEFNNLRCKIVQAFRRTVPWKKLAFGLAKKLFPEPADYRKWLKSVVHRSE